MNSHSEISPISVNAHQLLTHEVSSPKELKKTSSLEVSVEKYDHRKMSDGELVDLKRDTDFNSSEYDHRNSTVEVISEEDSAEDSLSHMHGNHSLYYKKQVEENKLPDTHGIIVRNNTPAVSEMKLPIQMSSNDKKPVGHNGVVPKHPDVLKDMGHSMNELPTMSLTGQGYYTYGEADEENSSFKPCSRSHRAKDHVATLKHETSKQEGLQAENQQDSVSKSNTNFDNVLKRQEEAPVTCTSHTRQSSQDLRAKQIYHKMKNEDCASNKDHKTKKDSEEDVTHNSSWSTPKKDNSKSHNVNSLSPRDSQKCNHKKYKSVKTTKSVKGEVPFYPDPSPKPTCWSNWKYIIAILLLILTVSVIFIVFAWFYIHEKPADDVKGVKKSIIPAMEMRY